MENSGKLFFSPEDDAPQWFVALGDRWVGPLTATDVYGRIVSSEFTPAHYIWREGQSEWKRISDVKTFQIALPSAPKSKPTPPPAPKTAAKKQAVPPAPPAQRAAIQREWFLYYNDTQFGPFATDEISRFLAIGKIHAHVHIWREGMKGWDPVGTVDAFKGDAKKAAPAPKPPAPAKPAARAALGKMDRTDLTMEQRRSMRAPLVAKVILANKDSVMTGICRDISVGGMQVLTDQIPGAVGATIKLNVTPADPGRGKQKIEAFVAEGVIVRILEDGRGFSFRFHKISDAARRTIEAYTSHAG